MSPRFTIYTWYEKNNRIQQGSFRRWNRSLRDNREKFEVVVFYSDESARAETQKFPNLRFWRLHRDMSGAQTALLNEALRYSRTPILVYAAPDVMMRNADLYRIANRVRSDFVMAWLDLIPGRLKKSRNKYKDFVNKIVWLFQRGRHELYAQLNHPFDFFRASCFAVQRESLDNYLRGTSAAERENLLLSDSGNGGYQNYYLFHIIARNGRRMHNEGRARSYDFSDLKVPLFYSYGNTGRLLRVMFKSSDFHFPVNMYRVLLPLMQFSQAAFLVLVWFAPLASLSLQAFYVILCSGLAVTLFKKNKASALFLPLWLFSWLVA